MLENQGHNRGFVETQSAGPRFRVSDSVDLGGGVGGGLNVHFASNKFPGAADTDDWGPCF